MGFIGAGLIHELCRTLRGSRYDGSKADVGRAGSHEVIPAGALNNGLFQKVMDWPLKQDASGLQFATENALKDVSCCNRVAADAGSTALIGATVQQIYALGQCTRARERPMCPS